VFDGLGYPDEHIDYARSNGLQGIAFTDHGNMNGLSHAYIKAKKMKDEGVTDFRVMYGIEAYVHPSIDQWQIDCDKIKEDAKAAKDVDEDVGLVVEDEKETKKGIRSILNKRSHLVLVAQNQVGLNNLFKMVSNSYKGNNFYRFPRMDYELLKKHNEGIIASSACLGGILSNDYWDNFENGKQAVYKAMEKSVEKLMDIFGDRFYGELQWANNPDQHIVNSYIIELSKQLGFKLISTCDSHYPSPDLWKDREIYKMLGWLGKKRDDLNIKALPSNLEELEYQLYPKNGDELFSYYRKFSKQQGFEYDDDLIAESIERTYDIMQNRVDSFLPENNIKLPSFVVPEGETADTALAKIAVESMRKKGLYKNKEYVDRLKEEIYTIKDRGFSKYFLTMKIITDNAKKEKICGAGRGSGAGSLVSYLLNITEVDPIKYKLQFSRFIRKTAKDWPDIDFDVSDAMKVKSEMIEQFGENRVVPISNYNTLQIRSLVKDVSKLFEIPFQEVNEVTTKMFNEATPPAKERHEITAGVYNPTWDELKEFSPTLQEYLEQYPDVAAHIETLQGQIRSISRHAGGVLFADNLDESMPLINSGGVTQTPWTEGQAVRHLEPLGFIKFDILGLKTLRVIEDCIRNILRNSHGIKNATPSQIREYYDGILHPEKIDLEDQEVFKNVFHLGKFCGIFQFTEAPAQGFCKLVKPKSITDLSAITSIYRPGPLSANVDKQYVEARNNPTTISYIHPIVEEVLGETYGFLIFQEQISLLAHKLGKNISLDEGNELRKVLTKKGTGKEAEVKNKLYQKFIDGCVEKGLTDKDGEKLWQTMEFFSGYGFNLSHATCYSILSYQCAYLLTYHQDEWVCAFLDNEPEKKKEKAISIAKSLGYQIKRLDINKSSDIWEMDADSKMTLVQPLSSVKGIGDAAVSEIVKHRPFKTVEELLFHDKMLYNKVSKKILDAVCRGGGLDDLMDNRFTGMKHLWSACIVDRPKSLKKLKENIEKYAPEGEFTTDEKIENIATLSGVFPVSLVMSKEIEDKLENKQIPSISDLEESGYSRICWFVPRKVEVKENKGGKEYWILEVTDDTGANYNIKVWGVSRSEHVKINKPYAGRVDKNGWGMSIKSPSSMKLLE